MINGVNDDELIDLLEFGRPIGAEVRFIEYMDVGGATHWSMPRVMARREMLARLEQHYGPIAPVIEESSAPADRYRLPDGMTFGIISSTTEPFCDACDRSRLTADGLWYLCSTRPTAPTCGGRCGLEPRPISSLSSFAPRGKFAATAVPRSASRRETAHRSSPWIASSAILTSRCTPRESEFRMTLQHRLKRGAVSL